MLIGLRVFIAEAMRAALLTANGRNKIQQLA
jgi:hypothetical protein